MATGLKITLGIIGGLLVLILIALGIYFLWPWNSAFFNNAKKEFDIPGLNTNFTAQGMANIDGTNKYIISGYMTDGSASRYYVVDSETGENYYVTLLVENEDYTGHAGGVEVDEGKVWTVSGDEGGYCYCFNLSDVLNAENGDKINTTGKFETNNGADFVFTNNGYLWVGEFHKEGTYDTDSSHHLTTTSGEINKAVVFAYEIDNTSDTGVVNNTPVMALSVRDLCQGIAMTSEGKFVMSTSYSIPDSNIYYYDNVLNSESLSSIKVKGVDVPLWFLDNNSLISKTNAPSMSEEIVCKDGKVYILFESACKKYRLYNRKKLSNVYSLELEKFENNK